MNINKNIKYVRITKNILKHNPNWKSIVGNIGIVLSKSNKSVYVKIITKGKSNLDIKYTIPIDSVEFILEKDAFERVL